MQTTKANLGSVTLEMLSAKKNISPDVTVVNMVPVLWNRLKGQTKNIGYTTFEADKIPSDWVKIINSFEGCWTTSFWNKEVMEKSGVHRPIQVVTPIAQPYATEPAGSGKFTFLSSFQWSERKNPHGLIKAFCAAFNGNPDVRLVIKTHFGSDAAASHNAIAKNINDMLASFNLNRQPDIQIKCNIESSEAIRQLNASSHAHISLSHGEGWGLPAWEAALAAKPVIATGWSAMSEWLGDSYPFKVRYNLSPVTGVRRDVSPFFDISMNWAEPHIDDAVDKMRHVFKNYAESSAVAKNKAEELLSRYNEERTLAAIVNSI